jgi:hypothetical protein
MLTFEPRGTVSGKVASWSGNAVNSGSQGRRCRGVVGGWGRTQKVSDLCFMVLFNFDLGLLAIQVTASIISTSEFDHDTERRKTGTETCIARLGVVLLLFMQCKVISRQEKKN